MLQEQIDDIVCVNNNSPHNFTIGRHDALLKQKTMVRNIWPLIAAETSQAAPDFAEIYRAVHATGLPNFVQARISLNSALNIHNWREALVAYHDQELLQFLEFGWRLGFYKQTPPVSIMENHQSARDNSSHVQAFITKECQLGAMLGPFNGLPFDPWTRISPMMTRPKKDSEDRRVIVDLSFPQGEDVNSGIDIDSFLGDNIRFTLPSILDLITKLQLIGPGAFIWKADLSRAYRQLRIDPLDVPLLGIKFRDQYYLDLCPAFGCRSSAAACQRMSSAVVYLMGQAGYHSLAYLDDFAGAYKDLQEAAEAYQHFFALADSLGLQLAKSKCVAPTKNIEWLGYKVDTTAMTVSIPQQKMNEVIVECQQWLTRRRVNKNMIQRLVGKILHVSNCIYQGRRFTSRVLDTLRAMGDRLWTTVDPEFIKDVRWFLTYALQANGVLIYKPDPQVYAIECDSSLEGAGGVALSYAYAWEYSEIHKDLFKSIHQLEATNIITAYRTFAKFITANPAQVNIYTDNISSAFALTSGKTKDKVLSACSRELWLLAATHGHDINIIHRPGQDIPLADALSRYHSDQTKADFANQCISANNIQLVPPALAHGEFFSTFI